MTASLYSQIMAPIVFMLVFLLVLFPRPALGRYFPTFLGALLMIQLDLMNKKKGHRAIEANLDALMVFLAILIMAACLDRVRGLTGLEWMLTRSLDKPGVTTRFTGYSGHNVLVRTCFLAALGSIFLTQEIWAPIMAASVLHVANRHDLPSVPLLLAVATSSSIGASCSPLGNLQNIIIANAGDIGFRKFLEKLGAGALVALVLNIVMLLVIFHRQLKGKTIIWVETPLDRKVLSQDETSVGSHLALTVGLSSDDAMSLFDTHRTSAAVAPVNSHPIDISHRSNLTVTYGSGSNQYYPLAGSTPPDAEATLPVIAPGDGDLPHSSSSALVPLSTTDRLKIEDDLRSHFSVAIEVQEQEPSLSSVTPGAAGAKKEPKIQPRSNQPHHPDLDLSQGWARTEYIRRLKLKTFHGVDMTDAHLNSTRLPKDAPHNFVYVQPDQHASPPFMAASLTATSSVSKDASLLELVRPRPPLLMSLPLYDPLRSPTAAPPPPEQMGPLDRLRSKMPGGNRERLLKIFIGSSISHTWSTSSLVMPTLMNAMIMIYIQREDPHAKGLWKKVDWARFLGFFFLIIVCQGLIETELPLRLWDYLGSNIDLTNGAGSIVIFGTFAFIAANTKVNFPLALLVSPMIAALSTSAESEHAWLLLAFISSIGGNMTLWGSVAAVMAPEADPTLAGTKQQPSQQPQQLWSFWRYLCWGVPTTILIFNFSMPVVEAMF